LIPERLTSTIGRAGLATTVSANRALITPVDGLASVEIDADGAVFSRSAWPRPIWGEIPYGHEGGALAWHNPDRVVLVRRTAASEVEEHAAPFRPLRVAIDSEGAPIWCGYEGGLWRWIPGQAPQHLVDTPAPIHLHVLDDNSVRIDPVTRASDGAAIRRRLRSAWIWRPGAPRIETYELDAEAQCTSIERAHGWSAAAHPYADLVAMMTPDGRTIPLGAFYPLTAAWAGSSLIVCSGEGDVLFFRDITSQLSRALG
jgi:hypothetical protein